MLNQTSTFSTMAFNNNGDITLTEDTTTTVPCQALINNPDGYEDVSSTRAVYYAASTTVNCTPNDNDCYEAACTLSGGAGDYVTSTCSTDMWFHAVSGTWYCQIIVTDNSNAVTERTSDPETVLELSALGADSLLDYGNVAANSDSTGDHIVNAHTSGNVPIDVNLSGTSMVNGAQSIPVSMQKYSTSSFVYGPSYPSLSGNVVLLDLNEVADNKPTTHPSDVNWAVYWQIHIPAGTPQGPYTGSSTYAAMLDTD